MTPSRHHHLLLFAGGSLVYLAAVHFRLPETCGKPLEEIENLFRKPRN